MEENSEVVKESVVKTVEVKTAIYTKAGEGGRIPGLALSKETVEEAKV